MLAILAAGLASADLTIRITATDGHGVQGGEFVLTHSNLGFTPVGLTGSNPIESFCMEKNEGLAFNYEYYACLNTASVKGGVGGGDPDPLSPLTAYIYTQFVTGQLVGYDYDLSDGGALRSAAADDLQSVIWFIEEEEPISWTPGDGSRRDAWYSLAIDNAGSGIGDVRVLNMFVDAGGSEFAQDQIILLPEPASLGLMAMGISFVRRRRSLC
jgi:hypothetical protein